MRIKCTASLGQPWQGSIGFSFIDDKSNAHFTICRLCLSVLSCSRMAALL